MNKKEAKYEPKLRPEIQLLMEIQKLDKALDDLKRAIRARAKEFDEVKGRLKKEEQTLETIKKRWEETVKERRQGELELKASEEKKKKFEAQEYRVKTNEEVRALRHEIWVISQQIDKLEDKILELLEEEERLKRQIEEEKVRLELEKQKAEKEKGRIEGEIEKAKVEYQEVAEKREAMVQQLPEKLKDYYHSFCDRYPGEIVVTVVNGSCGGCFMQILPQRLVGLHLGEEIIFCDKCQRLLAYDEDFNPDTPEKRDA